MSLPAVAVVTARIIATDDRAIDLNTQARFGGGGLESCCFFSIYF